jgi:hypothetical protein
MGLTDSPPKIKTIRIVENPFDDIVPRITAAEKREQMKAKLEAKVEMEKRDKRSKAKKWVYLFFSFHLVASRFSLEPCRRGRTREARR